MSVVNDRDGGALPDEDVRRGGESKGRVASGSSPEATRRGGDTPAAASSLGPTDDASPSRRAAPPVATPAASRIAPLIIALPASALAALVFAALALSGGSLGSGGVVVGSSPPGASVFVDDEFRGVTPVELDDLASRAHALRLEKAGFETYFGTLRDGRPTEGAPPAGGPSGAPPPGPGLAGGDAAAIALRPAAVGTLVVASKPQGADVFLGGEFRGTTPLTIGGVRAGPHVLRLEKTNHLPRTASVLVRAGETMRYRLGLDNRVIEFLKRAVEASPKSPLCYMELGHYSMLLEEPEQAARAYAEATLLVQGYSSVRDARRKVEHQLRYDRQMGRLGARMGAELDRILRERRAGGAR